MGCLMFHKNLAFEKNTLSFYLPISVNPGRGVQRIVQLTILNVEIHTIRIDPRPLSLSVKIPTSIGILNVVCIYT